MKRIYDSLPSGKITKETDRKIHKYFIDIASHANNKCDDRITRRVYLNKDKEVSIKVVYFINNVTVHNNTIEIPQTVNGGYDFSHLSLKGIVIKDEDLSIRILQVADYKTLFFRTVICIKRILISP